MASTEVRPVTKWFKINDKGKFEFNHLEDGHASTKRPASKHENHVKAWARGEWKLEHAHLSNDVPPKIIENEK